jgi:RHS repeat-associated protein
MVMSFNEATGKKEPAKVSMAFDGEWANEYVMVNGKVGATMNHLFYSSGQWKEIGSLGAENPLLGLDLTDQRIEKVEKVQLKEKVQVYNLEVDGNHNYFVVSPSNPAEGYLVHNKLVFGGTSTTSTTTFIGSLYEETNNRGTKHIYLGDMKIASVTGGRARYHHADHLGGANVLSNSDGDKVELIEYEPFGKFSRNEKYGNTEDVARFYFTGQRYDEDTELYYYNARYYDPGLGRFITPDIFIQRKYDPQTFNRYSYVRNNPTNLVDPSGHFFQFIVAAVVAAVKGVAIGAVVGAGVAAVTGGDIGRGALFGAITGGAFAGFGSLAQSAFRLATIPGGIGPMTAGATSASSFIGGVVGGAAGGAAGSAFLGADPFGGAGIGALSGGLFGGISGMKGTGWAGVGRVALAGVAGGAISEAAGGSFLEGFVFASSVASADFIYRAILQSGDRVRGASMRTATRNGEPKLDVNGRLIYDSPVLPDMNISQPGFSSKPAETASGFWNRFAFNETSPVMNSLGKNVPGIQGLSLAHDITGNHFSNMVGQTANNVFFNFQTMPPVYGLNLVGSAVNDSPALIGVYEANRRDF